jgi:uncharacterized protein (TIGR03435 family)
MILRMVAVGLVGVGIAVGQSSPAPKAETTAKPMAFEVVSIRPSKPGGSWRISWSTSPDGYRVTGQSLRSTLLMAYVPQGMAYWSESRLQGAPSWMDDLYDIEAKVAPEDVAEWQKQGLRPEQKKMLQEMLKTMLAERCKLVVHQVPAEIPGYALVVGKHGSKLTEAKADEVFPAGMKLPGGGALVPYQRGEKVQTKFFGTSMTEFAQQLSMMSGGHPVLDKSSLSGKYDFVLVWGDTEPGQREGVISSDDPNPLSHWDVNALGLELKSIKVPTETVVIDHIERPSEN